MSKLRIPSPAKMQDWLRDHKFERVIRTVEAVPIEQRTAEHTLCLAQAYLIAADMGTPKGRQQMKHARKLLVSIQSEVDTLNDPYAWYASMATELFYTDNPAAALPYAKRAVRLKPDDQNMQSMVYMCHEVIQRPRARWTYREGVARAWDKFFQKQTSILRQLEGEQMGRCSERLERPVSFCFEAALIEPDCSVWKTADKPRLVFDTHCNPIRMLQILNLLQQAPGAVLVVWDLQLGPLPDRDSPEACLYYLEYGDTPVQLYTDEAGEIVSATMDGQPLFAAEMLEQMYNSTSKKSPAFRDLMNMLGPVPLWRLETQRNQQLSLAATVPLQELSEMLAAHGLDCSMASASRAFPMNAYLIKRSYPVKAWRKHVEVGNGRIPTVVNSIVDRLYFFNNQMIQEGVEGGYFVWPMPQRRRQAAVNKANQLQQEIQDKLNKRLGSSYLTVLGKGMDANFVYLDFVAWDLQSVLEAAADLLQGAGLPWAAYQPFRDYDPAISLFGFPAPPLQRR